MPSLSSRIVDAFSKPVPEPLAPPDHYDPADVAAMPIKKTIFPPNFVARYPPGS